MDQNCLLELMNKQMPPAAAEAWKTRLLQSQNSASQTDLLQKISSLVKGGGDSQFSSRPNNNLNSAPTNQSYALKSSNNNNNNVPLSHALFRKTLTPLIPDSQFEVNECQAVENPSPNSILSGPESPPRFSQSIPGLPLNSLSTSDIEQVLKIQLFQNDRVNPFSNYVSDNNNNAMDYDALVKLLSVGKGLPTSIQNSFDQQTSNNNRLLEQFLLLQNLNIQNQQIGRQGQKDQIRQHLETQYLSKPQTRSKPNDFGMSSSNQTCNYGLGDSSHLGVENLSSDPTWFGNSASDLASLIKLENNLNSSAFLSNWEAVSEPLTDWPNLGNWFCEDSKPMQTANMEDLTSPKLASVPSTKPSRAMQHEPNPVQSKPVSAPVLPHSDLKKTTPVVVNPVRTAPQKVAFKPGQEPISSAKLHQILSQIPTRRKRGAATDMQSLAARARRERITRKMRTLHELVPGGRHLDTAAMLQQAIEYVRSLQSQLEAAKEQGVVIKTKEEIDQELIDNQHK